MGKRKSIAKDIQKLEFLGGGTGEVNVEDDMDVGPKLLDSDWEESDQDGALHPTKRRLGFKGDLVVEGNEYSGRRTSRAHIFGEDAQGSNGQPILSSLSELARSEDDDHSSDEIDWDTAHTNTGTDGEFHSIKENHGGSCDELVEEGEKNDDDEDEDSVDDEYNRLHVDDPCSVSRLQLRARADHEKGLAVKRQKIYWEHWLGLRIMLQKSLSVVNSVGFLSTAEAVRGAGGKVANAFQDASEEVYSACKEILSLQDTVADMSSDVVFKKRQCETNTEEKCSSEDLWKKIDERYLAFAEFRDVSLDRFHRQAMLQSGAVQRSSLKILQQGISAQVSAQLRAPQRLIVRSQVARPNGTPVDAPFKNLEEVTGSEQDPDIYRDPHSYDDSQFYQQLLKEFLESKGLGSVAVDAAVKKQQHRKAVRGHQRCKGRALRYTVNDKLVNFMTPVDMEPSSIAAQLFQNLFGHTGL